LSGQEKFKEFPKKFKSFLKYYDYEDENIYDESCFAVKMLVENFGKKKLIHLIKSLKNINSNEKFNEQFKKIYNNEPSYEFFNNLLKNSKK
jgi:hypothetical protein